MHFLLAEMNLNLAPQSQIGIQGAERSERMIVKAAGVSLAV